jgi:SAM-dependent methyltransferase
LVTGETRKAHERRLREGWFDKYAPPDQAGLDIGCGLDPLNETFRRYDIIYGDGDATELMGIPPGSFWTVYASHILEHIKAPRKAIERWYEVLKPGGHLIMVVPHRDLYERKRLLPSRWNIDHKWFWLPMTEEPPCTKSLTGEVSAALIDQYWDMMDLRVLDEGYDHSLPKDVHAVGEFSIEIVIRKQRCT